MPLFSLKSVRTKNICKRIYIKISDFNQYFLFLPSLFLLLDEWLGSCGQCALSSNPFFAESGRRTVDK